MSLKRAAAVESHDDDAKLVTPNKDEAAVPILDMSGPARQPDDLDECCPPGLGYDLTPKRKKSITKQMTFIIGINTFAPTLIFFLYKHLAGNYDVNPALTYTWVTLALGTIELFQWPYRSYLLCRDNFARSGRPIVKEEEGGGNHRLRSLGYFWTRQDFFGLMFFLAIIIGAILLTLCCSLGGTRGSIPLLIISIPSIVLFLGIVLAITSICTSLQVKTPVHISSLPKYQAFRPGVYFAIEDIIAVEGGGGYEFRKRISNRYEASAPFRKLMQNLNFIFTFWAFILFLVALILVVINVKGHLNEDIVYGVVVGFSVVWSGVVAIAAWYYSQWALKQELKVWKQDTRNTIHCSGEGNMGLQADEDNPTKGDSIAMA